MEIVAKEFMGNDGVFAVDNCGIVTAFIEHTHVHTQDTGEIHSTSHSPFIRADDHQMVFVDLQIRNGTGQSFDILIWRIETVKTIQWNRIADTGIMASNVMMLETPISISS